MLIFSILGHGVFYYISYKIDIFEKEYRIGFIQEVHSELKGKVVEFPSYRFSNNQYIVELENQKTHILIYTEPYQKFSYIDQLHFTGKLRDVRDESKEWTRYYKDLGVQYVIFYPQIISHTVGKPDNLYKKFLLQIFKFKLYIRSQVLTNFSSHTSALILGMLLGEKNELSKEEKNIFNNANISHILVVSGYNISLVISLIFTLLKGLPRIVWVGGASIGIVVFVFLVGLGDSVVRAAIMGTILIYAQLFNQKSSAIHTLCLAACIMLICNPYSLFNAGFHLSFLATFLLLILPKWEKIPEYILSSLWIFFGLSLYIIFLSEKFSTAGIFSNLLILFVIPIFMLVSACSIFLQSFGIHILIDVFFLELSVRYIFFIVSLIKYVPQFSINIPVSFVILVYIFSLSFFIFLKNKYTMREFIEKHYQKFVPHKTN
jgi:competence protein ComEC